MADSKISALSALTTLTDDDLFPVVNDPAGTPATRKATVATVRSSLVPPSLVAFPGLGVGVLKRVFSPNSGSGDIDLYTCPSGKRALIGEMDIFNPTAGSLTATPKIKRGSTYYLTTAVQTINAGVRLFGSSGGFVAFYALEAGEKLAVTTSGAGLNVGAFILEFPDTSPVKGVFVTPLSNGLNTVYTCPVGKSAYVYDLTNNNLMRFSRIFVSNQSGGSRNYTLYFVPSGQSADSTTQMSPATAVGDGAVGLLLIDSFLEAGDSIIVNTNNGAAGQSVFFAVCEIDA